MDFSDKDVIVKVNEYDGRINIDYETMHVALYHIIENAAKYVRPKTNLFINFKENTHTLKVEFVMESLFIEELEKDRIYEEGYSGLNVKNIGKQGEGIGMYRILRLVKLNNAKFETIRGETVSRLHGIKFANNKFILEFQLN